jgi:hypothetical protein
MQKSKDTKESVWQTATRNNKRNNRQNTNRPDNRVNNESGYKEEKQPGRNQIRRNRDQQNVEKTRKNIEQKKYTQPEYTGPDFSIIIPKNENKPDTNKPEDVNSNDTDHSTNVVFPIPKLTKFRPSTKNQIPLRYSNSSYGTWEITYFKHLLNLCDIFTNAINELDIQYVDTKSADFLHVFGKFIRSCSSGKISPYMEDLNEKEEKIYIEYAIKRNES